MEMEHTHKEAYCQLEHLYQKKQEHEADRFLALEVEKSRLNDVIRETKTQIDERLQEDKYYAEEELERQIALKNMEIKKYKDLIAFAQYRFESMLENEGE